MSKYNSAHGLGRGLSALLGDIEQEDNSLRTESIQTGDTVKELSLNDIDTDAEQPRKVFDEEALKELADSIASVGVIQPIVVVPHGERYRIVVGERRFRASRMAGKTTIPAIVRSWDEMTRLKSALIENLQRENLNPIETAQGIRALMEKCDFTQEEAANVVGKSRSAVANTLRLLTLPEEVRKMLEDGRLSAGHARALVTVSPERQLKLANMAAQLGWSVRQLEQICARSDIEKPAQAKPVPTPQMKKLVKMAREAFGVQTRIEGDESKGKLTFTYTSAEELQGIWDLLEMINQGAQ